MDWASAISTATHTGSALRELVDQIDGQLDEAPDLVLAFVSSHHGPRFEPVAIALAEEFPDAVVLGCSAGGVVGAGQEVERRSGVSVIAARLPDVDVIPLRFVEDELPDPDAPREAWEQILGVEAAEDPHFVVLPDPFTFDPGALLLALDRHFPAAAKVGGLVSGAREPGAAALIVDDRVYRHGFVGLALSGAVGVDTVVAQGCRPVGPPMFVTRCERNCILELDGRKPVEALRDVFDALTPRDRQLFEHALFVGVQTQDQTEYQQGDFLIRNVVGLHRDTGALVVGAIPEQYQVVQMHVRDSRASAEDLDALLARYDREHADKPRAGLMFSCVGRGEGLYGRPNHDSELVARHLGPIPIGGFFSSGEIGPVHGRTFVHGYTSSFGLFRST